MHEVTVQTGQSVLQGTPISNDVLRGECLRPRGPFWFTVDGMSIAQHTAERPDESR